jgi:hypothetical protein
MSWLPIGGEKSLGHGFEAFVASISCSNGKQLDVFAHHLQSTSN